MTINSKKKGSKGEWEFCNKFNALFGTNLRRSQQYCGANNDADVVGIDGIHFEVKRVEKLNLSKAMDQALNDCGDNIPVVAHRRSREPWMITVRLEDLEKLFHFFNS